MNTTDDVTAYSAEQAKQSVLALVAYALQKEIIEKQDTVWAVNTIWALLGEPGYTWSENELEALLQQEPLTPPLLEQLFSRLQVIATHNGITIPANEDGTALSSYIMGALMPRPSWVAQHFWQLMHADSSPDIASKQATDWFYKLSCDCDYVRLNAIRRDVKWTVPTQWGDLEITINRSKPEKDPRAIAAALKNPRPKENEPYPACQLCFENEGYWGRSVDSANGSHPARHNLRVVPITLNHEDWGLQYSPYAYYREHCIVMNRQHIPMHVDVENITRLLDFVDMFPHYFVGSNAGLPIVGGSILTHDHFQGGRYEFPLDKAPVIEKIELSKNDFAEVEAGIVRWPLTVIRLKSRSREQLLKAAGHILGKWQDFSDAEAGLIAHEPDGTSHNAVTPYAHKEDGVYRLDLALRNNQTSPERPMGIFHPREELHHIKRENIGLIEVAGMAILPGRLIAEMDALQKAIQEDPTLMRDYAETPIQKHILWAQELMRAYESSHGATPTGEDLHDLLYQGIGEVFAQVLEDCAVFSQTPTGQVSLKRFLTTL